MRNQFKVYELSLAIKPLNDEESRFITFELDLRGHKSGFEDWGDGQIARKFSCRKDDKDCGKRSTSPVIGAISN